MLLVAVARGGVLGAVGVCLRRDNPLCRAVYELQGDGKNGQEKYFRKPWAMVLIMFIAMTFCLPVAWLEEWQASKKKRKDEAAIGLLGGGPEASAVRAGFYRRMGVI